MTKCNLLVEGRVKEQTSPGDQGSVDGRVTEQTSPGDQGQTSPREQGSTVQGSSHPGYQILTLHFEAGIGGRVKAAGGSLTQKVPSSTAKYQMSDGRSGKSMRSSMAAGCAYHANVRSSGDLLHLQVSSG